MVLVQREQGSFKGRKEVKLKNCDIHYNRYMNREVTKTKLAEELEVTRPTLDKLIKQ